MSTTDDSSAVNAAPPPIEVPAPELIESKYTIRKQVWTHFDKNNLVTFPRPVRGRIPNFHGSHDAAVQLTKLDVFKNATTVKVNPDKPQEHVRILTLESKKKLLVSSPRLKEAILLEVKPPPNATTYQDFRRIVSRKGMLDHGIELSFDKVEKIDLMVLGSVAVSRTGRRVGKGEGFVDLEFGLMTQLGAITQDTVIVTIVHDSQVLETLPDNLFKPYDIPVDIIVTPTEVIHVSDRLNRPVGIDWSMISKRRMALMTALSMARNKQIEAGQECHLKEEDTDEETENNRRRLHRVITYRFYRKPRNSKSRTENDENKEEGEKREGEQDGTKKEKNPRRKKRLNARIAGKKQLIEEVDENGVPVQRTPAVRRRRVSRKSPIQFSLKVGNIGSNVRVRDLKNALAERNVKPTDITWRGHRGFAFLHFAKPKEEPDTPVQVDNIVASLQDMKIVGGEGVNDSTLSVEPAKPITRIETTDITTV